MSGDDLSRLSMLELFRMETETQIQLLTSGLLALERHHTAADQLELCMRAAHSLKGAARIAGVPVGVKVSHAMEECFVAAQQGRVVLQQIEIDRLLAAVDLLARIAAASDAELPGWDQENRAEINACLSALEAVLAARDLAPISLSAEPGPAGDQQRTRSDEREPVDRVLRVTAENLNRLLGLAAESLVESRWIKPFGESLTRVKRAYADSARTIERLREFIRRNSADEAQASLVDVERHLLEARQLLSDRLAELDMFDRRSTNLSHRLYEETVACRMRPFADLSQALPRTVRDLARSLGKQVRLELAGESTQVDRDVLQKLDAPLGHLLRNAVDHGLEAPDERVAAGKTTEGTLRVEARHSAGVLQVIVSDDGRGVDLQTLRRTIVERRLTTADTAKDLSDAELLEFLFLPGFSMKDTLTEISGRGVGLDAVREMVKQVRGSVRVSSEAGRGTRFHLQLPVTLSVVRTFLAEIGGEPYAFPLASIIRAVNVETEHIETVEGRQHFSFEGRSVGLIMAQQVLELTPAGAPANQLSVIVIGDTAHSYGLIVDRFLGERELVVRPLDPLLGKIKDIAAASLMEDGSPVLIVDTDDMIRSTHNIISGSRVTAVRDATPATGQRARKRVLVVDDSLTVREVERKLLGNHGYDVEIAVDGMDGWNAVRTGRFDLVVTDVDMPRMDGIELVTMINRDPNLKSIPVMIVSYKDRDEDRRRGLEAGAAYYLTKSTFHDDALVEAVVALIGEADA